MYSFFAVLAVMFVGFVLGVVFCYPVRAFAQDLRYNVVESVLDLRAWFFGLIDSAVARVKGWLS
jgi:hypothetical protein